MLNGGTDALSTGDSVDRNQNGLDDEENDKKVTPFERLSQDLSNDPRVLKEITLGKRIGFYRIRGELGSGNFSQVKMGIHALTKGEKSLYIQNHTGWRNERKQESHPRWDLNHNLQI